MLIFLGLNFKNSIEFGNQDSNSIPPTLPLCQEIDVDNQSVSLPYLLFPFFLSLHELCASLMEVSQFFSNHEYCVVVNVRYGHHLSRIWTHEKVERGLCGLSMDTIRKFNLQIDSSKFVIGLKNYSYLVFNSIFGFMRPMAVRERDGI